nr:unnamed protein product [Digitaria exilis]
MAIPTVDLRGVAPGAPGWDAARDAVTASMVAHGCVVVAHGDDALGPELRRALFARALPELFALPLESKQRTVAPTNERYKEGYNQIDGMPWESFRITEPTDAAKVRGVADILWPEGNTEFCETIVSFAKNMLKLDEMLEALVLEGLGVQGQGVRAHLDLLGHSVYLSHYGTPVDRETNESMQAHYDDSMNTIIVQHEVEGLEVRLADGRWVAVPPEPGTLTFMAGEQLRVATNGRVPACFHRVRTPSSRERFAVLFGFLQKPGIEVRALEELVDEEHPLVFNPLKHEEYKEWRYSEEGFKVDDALKAFCGVEKVAAMV